MEVLVTYDVSTESTAGRRRLRKIAEICLAYGQRVQKSVFECTLNEIQFEQFKHELIHYINEKEDNLRIYRLPQSKEPTRWHFGNEHLIDVHGPLIV